MKEKNRGGALRRVFSLLLALMLLAAQLFGLPKPGGELNAVDGKRMGTPLLDPKEAN